ncbi:MAG TPA: SPOR domain-containing protein [Rhizomicrobium sp.]|jgi:D-alanyl-D-alanine carboxypeptidase|nr:SPOR domain-containing protein [Rhizomicrobium sp.]
MFEQPRARFGALARTLFVLGLLGLAAVAGTDSALARGHRHWGHRAAIPIAAGATDPSKDAALIADGETGRIIYERNATAERHPASLTKMMTLYLLFEQLKRGDMNMQTMLPISAHAASQHPTNLHLYAGDALDVNTAIKAIVVRSANDVAVAIGESIGGTEGHFAELMTAKARQLGMHNTFYHNASGLPDPLQITTAADLLVLARHLAYDFPQYFPYFSTPGFTFRGVYYPTHDNLIGRYEGADGIKTGYTGMSGFNLVSSITRNGTHVIGVVMGGRTAHRRDLEMVRLLDAAYVQIGQNPSLVAHNGVPWRSANVAVAANAPIANMDVAPTANDDEDAAESAASDQDDDANVIAAPPPPRPNLGVPNPGLNGPSASPAPPAVAPQPPAPQPRVAMLTPPPVQTPPAAKPQPIQPAPFKPVRVSNVPHPKAKPAEQPQLVAVKDAPHPIAKPIQVAVTAPQPVAKPSPKAPLRIARNDVGEGDVGGDGTPVPMGPKAWTIQIGAFADANQARGQLASYAEKSMDILGQAARIVLPFQGVDGHTLYRARFGPFVEREAREVCSRLTQRGQTCFTVLASSH